MSDDRKLARNPIAIVGMSGLLPRARNYREYWRNIVEGVDCVEEVPESRWRLDDYYDADPNTPDKTYSRHGAFLPDIDFDPIEFGLPPNQLEVTSTMQTLSLGVARDLLIDAGATGSDWYDASRTGVVLGTTGPVPLMHPLAARLSTPVLKEAARSVGLSDADADAIAAKFVAAYAPWEENSFPGLLANVVSGRVANRLGLGGINCTVDAACAASLAAIRTAIAELVDGRADTMITGGVDTENTIFIYMCFSKVGALSPTGRISPFSSAANGTLLGEGITMLALRRLADAERDGNRIYAVIRGLGSSSDGRSKSIYAPVAAGQRVALDRAYADAECSPSSVELFEAHATGTAVGDKTELTALKGLLAEASSQPQFAALGSVKSQIGHTKGAAGTASLMKLALGLYHKVLPGTINVTEPNPEIDSAAPFYVNTRTRPWVLDPQRGVRRAAASAMGFGGTNFHIVLEEATGPRGPVLHDGPRAYLWHAADLATLVDVVRTAAPSDGTEIPESHARVGFVAIDDDMATHLRELAVELLSSESGDSWEHPEGVFFRATALANRKAAALFAGQGSQYLDMGSSAVLNNPPIAAAFDAANAAFGDAEQRLGAVVFAPPAFDDNTRAEQETTLRRTEFAQPAIGALSAGQFQVLREFGFRADGFLGHSFGELTALWASGALSDTDFFGLARARGAAMAVPEGTEAGRMLAVAAPRPDVEALIAGIDDVWVCNHNAPEQVVVGGGSDGIDAVIAAGTEKGWTTRELPVAAAFHTPYVGHAVDGFRPAVAAVTIGEPAGPVFANSPGAGYGADVDANRATLVNQLLSPVEFASGLSAMAAAGCNVFVEFGPKQVLTSLVRRTLGDDVIAIGTDVGPIGDSDLALKRAAVRLAVLGFDIRGINRYLAAPVAAPAKPKMAVKMSAPEYVPEARRTAYAAALADGYTVSVAAPAPANGHIGNGNGAGHAASTVSAGNLGAAPAHGSGPASGDVPGAAAADVSGSAPAHSADATPVSSGNGAAHQPAPARPASAAATPAPTFTESAVTATHHDSAAYPAQPGLDNTLDQHLQTHRQYLDGQLDLARGLVGALASGSLDDRTLRAIEAVKDHGLAISESHMRASEVITALAELEGGVAGSSVEFAARPAFAPQRQLAAPAPAALAAPAAPAAQAAPAPAAYAAPAAPAATAAASPVAPAAPTAAAGPATPAVPRATAAPATPEAPAAAAISADALRTALLEIVGEKTGYPVEMVNPAMDLEADLGVDSIKRVQVIGALQERFPSLPTLGPEQLGVLRTLDQIVEHLVESAPAATASAPSPVPAADDAAVQSVSADALRTALLEIVGEKTGYPVEMVNPAMDLEADLGVDSIKRVQVIGALQERFPSLPTLGPEQLGVLRTLDQIVAHLVESAPAETAPAATASAPVAAASAGADGAALRAALLEIVGEKTGYPVEMVNPDMDLEADLGVDSIKRVQVIGALQERFPNLPTLGPEQLGVLRTLNQIVEHLAGSADPKAEAAGDTAAPVTTSAAVAHEVAAPAEVPSAPRHLVEVVGLPAIDRAVEPYRTGAHAVVVALDSGSATSTAAADAAALGAALTELGWTVAHTTDPESLAGAEPLDLCLVVLGGSADWEGAQESLAAAIIAGKHAVPRLAATHPVAQATQTRAGFATLTRLDGTLGFAADPVSALLAGVGGVVKTVAAEQPTLFCRAIDLDPEAAIALAIEELHDAALDTLEVGVSADGTRCTLVPSRHGASGNVTQVQGVTTDLDVTLTADDVLLVTGGARGVTALCVRELARHTPATFVLLGRTELADEPEWAVSVPDSGLKLAAVKALGGPGVTPRDIERACSSVRANREIRDTLQDLGVRGHYVAGDVAGASAATGLGAALAPWAERITGVVHGAGVLADSMITDKTVDSVQRVLTPKLAGLANVLAAVGTVRHLVLFTSVAGLFGNAGQSDYAAANEALSRFAASWKQANPDAHVTAIDWGAWDGGMVTPELRGYFLDRGIPLLHPLVGARAFAEQFTAERGADTVVLVAEAISLSESEPVVPALRAARRLAGLPEDPIIAAHRIGDNVVLPATFGLGALINTVERATPGRYVVGVRDFQVLKGMVFGQAGEAYDAIEIVVEPVGETVARVRAGRNFRATLELAAAAPDAPRLTLDAGEPRSAASIYTDGVQFHAPALQGMQTVRTLEATRFVVECKLPGAPVADGSYAGALHNPVLADLILQAPPVLGHRILGSACLPLGIGRVEYFAPLPEDGTFVVTVDNPRASSVDVLLDATATALDGTVLQRFSDVTVVTTADLSDKFADSVKAWMS